MPEFGWTRLAYSLLVLGALTAIIQIGSPDAATWSPAPEPPGKATAAVRPVDVTESDGTTATALPEEDAQASLAARHAEAPDELAGSVNPEAAAARKAPPPVFRRPSPAIPGGAQRGGTERVCGDLRGFSSDSRVLFPLSKAYFGSYEDTWGAPRPQGGHEGTDLMIPTGAPEYAMTDGTVVPVAGSNENGWNSLGGYAVMIEAAYSVGPIRKGDLFYYAHLKRESDLEIGATVSAGQVLGYAGDTGQGPEVTSGLFPPHLHFGWYDTTGARSDLDSGAMNPFPLLEWVEANGGALRGGSNARYCEAPQTGTPRPSTGGDRWPAPKDPGVRSDLSAGSPEPSPVVRKQTHEHEARRRQAGPEKRDARPPENRSGKPESQKGEPPRSKAPPPDPRAEKGEPDEGREPDRPGEKRENRKDRDQATKTPPAESPPKEKDPPEGAPEKAPDKDKEREKSSRPPDAPSPPSDETEDTETTTAENGEEPGDSEPEEPSAETTTAGG